MALRARPAPRPRSTGTNSRRYPPNFGGVIKEDATFDIGSDTRTTVDDSYKLPFRFTGKIDKLTYKLGPEQMTNDEQKRIRHAMERARD
jgi:hypothetical protein